MRRQGEGRILITGSIAGFIPGSYQAVYNGSKAFLDSFSYALRKDSYALREELKDTRITVTCLMPGPTETEFFRRADMMDTKVGSEEKDDPGDVAKDGFEAMMAGKDGLVSGWRNKLEAAAAHVMPATSLAKRHTKMAAPGTAKARAGRKPSQCWLLVLAQRFEDVAIEVEVRLHHLMGSERHQLGKRYIDKYRRPEQLQETNRGIAGILDEMSHRHRHAAHIAGLKVECARFGFGCEHGHTGLPLPKRSAR
jgi:hypothetical protein